MAKKTANGKNGSPLGFEAQLWAAADALRNNMDAAEYKHHIGPNPVGAKNFSPLQTPVDVTMPVDVTITGATNRAPMTSPRHHRHSIRLPGYDYSQAGAYFVTICAKNRECLFGEVGNGMMRLNDAGNVAQRCWQDIPCHFPHAELDEFVIMPNHVHGIVVIVDRDADDRDADDRDNRDDRDIGAKNFSPLRQPPNGTSKTIGSIVRGFKIGVTKWMRQNMPVQTVWQRNYYEHVIRNEDSLDRIRLYVVENPARWAYDRENPEPASAETKEKWAV